jgi:hypothetical protein
MLMIDMIGSKAQHGLKESPLSLGAQVTSRSVEGMAWSS